MPNRIVDVMTPNPLTIPENTLVREAAEAMRANDIGDVIVTDNRGKLVGIVTDRDVVVRVVAEGRDPRATCVGDIASRDLTAVAPNDRIDHAVDLMRERAIRRLPVVDKGKPIGIVTIGDLALNRDPDSALADISGAPPNV